MLNMQQMMRMEKAIRRVLLTIGLVSDSLQRGRKGVKIRMKCSGVAAEPLITMKVA
jgi:hypothetical protein